MSKNIHNVNNDDLIEIKKMKQGLIDVIEIPKTPKQKLTGWPAFTNYLRYHIWHIVSVVVVIALLSSYLYTRVTTKTPDCLIVANTGMLSLNSATKEYSKEFSKLCSDTNGDGVSLIELVDCSYSDEMTDAEEINALVLKFQAQFNVNYAQLFILNYKTMVKLDEETEGGLWIKDLNLKDYNGKAIKLNDTKFEEIIKSKNGVGFAEDVYICMRRSGDKISGSKRGKAAIKAAREVLKELNNQLQ